MVSDMQRVNQAGGGLPMFIAADQEGGIVSRLGFGTRGVGNMSLAATGDVRYARDMARIHGEELRLLGINVNFAPVVDLNDNAANPVIGVRSFGDDTRTVSEYGCAALQGLWDAGVIPTLKHFPGHGNTDTDSHTGLPLVDCTKEALQANELVPFKAAIDAGSEMVMTAHIQYPQLETQTYTSVATGEQIYIPATMSRTILTDLLRGELGFEGIIVSDALDMNAIWDNFTIDDMVTLTINAGVDMLILPSTCESASLEQVDEMLERAVALTQSGVIDPARVDDAVRRILALKQKHGLLAQTDFSVDDAAVAAAEAGCGSAEHRQAAWDIACKSLTLLKNENSAFPMDVKPGEKTLVLCTAASRSAAWEVARAALVAMNALPEGAQIEGMVIDQSTAQACVEAAAAADHALLISRAWNAASLDPATGDGYPVGVVNQVIDALHAAGKTAVVISAQLPYDAACYPEADAVLLAYCSSPMRSVPPETGADSAWTPNLPAAICAAFGAVQPQGRLPVNLPKLDADFHLTQEIMYARQDG